MTALFFILRKTVPVFPFCEKYAVHTVILFTWHLVKRQVHALGGRKATGVLHGPIGNHRKPLAAARTPCTYHCVHN